MKIKHTLNQDAAFYTKVEKALHDSQPNLNAVVTFMDISAQLQEPKTGRLAGVPIVLKDNISTKGVKTTASSKILANYVPIFDATIVEKLTAEGAVFVAKSSMDELGMGGTNLNAATGRTCNPWDLSRITGGSSGGSAALVAQGVVPVAIGTDTGDSVRKPAAYCGVVGLKPTYGRISRYGIIPYASSLDHVGIFSTCIKDGAEVLEVLMGRDDQDMTSSHKEKETYASLLNKDIKGKTIGIFKNVQVDIEDERITKDFDLLCEKLKQQGAILKDIVFDAVILHSLLPTYFILSNAEATANHSNLDGIRFGVREAGDDLADIMIHSRTKGFSSSVKKRFMLGSYSLFVENQEKILRKAQRVRRLIVEELDRQLASCDVILSSSAGDVAPLPQDAQKEKIKAAYMVSDNHMLLANFSGYPAISVPTNHVEGMPIGVHLIAKAYQEQVMLDVAYAIEDCCDQKGNCVEDIR